MKPANNAPMHCAMYVSLAEICRSHGYALAVHGTLARDFDMVAAPWADNPSDPQIVVDAITSKHAVNNVSGSPEMKKHNRICYTLALYGEFFFDFSFMQKSQHLRQIQADAGRDGFVAGADSMKLAFQYGGTYCTEGKANAYADKVRQGG